MTELTTDGARATPRRPLRFAKHPAVWIAVIDIALVVVFGLTSADHVFFNAQNLTNIALDSAQIVLLASGIALLLGAAELDISVGANVILSSVACAKTIVAVTGGDPLSTGEFRHLTLGITLGVCAAIGTGLCFGLANGLIVTQLGVNSFIGTLGTLGIGTGIALVLTGGSNIQGLPTELQNGFGVRDVAGLPLPTLVAGAIVLVLWVVLTKTRFGLRTLAIGSSREAADRAGLRIGAHVLLLFVIVGFVAGVAGVIDVARFTSTNVGGHQTDALSAIAGAVIGGTSLFGGRVSIVGAVLGALLAVILQTGLVILGLSPFYQPIAIGGVLVGAVFLRSRSSSAGRGGAFG